MLYLKYWFRIRYIFRENNLMDPILINNNTHPHSASLWIEEWVVGSSSFGAVIFHILGYIYNFRYGYPYNSQGSKFHYQYLNCRQKRKWKTNGYAKLSLKNITSYSARRCSVPPVDTENASVILAKIIAVSSTIFHKAIMEPQVLHYPYYITKDFS